MNSLTTSPSYVPRVCYFPASLDCTKWERVGATIRPDQIHVGAVNCAKHGSLCRSLKVHGYPSLVAVNWPGAPQGTPEQPSVNLFKFGTHSFEDTMTNIEAAFPGVMGVPRELEGNFDYGMEAGKVGGGGRGGAGGAVRASNGRCRGERAMGFEERRVYAGADVVRRTDG